MPEYEYPYEDPEGDEGVKVYEEFVLGFDEPLLKVVPSVGRRSGACGAGREGVKDVAVNG